MISALFKRKAKVTAPSMPRVPEKTVVWAVGDVHGRLDLLKPLVEAIMTDAAASAAERKVVIFLGDYIDRGPDSRGVVRYLAGVSANTDIEWRFLMGNHEKTLLNFLDDPSVGPRWCDYGGQATIRSYGLRIPDLKHKPEVWAHLAADLRHKLSEREMRFFEEQELSITVGDYFFAHAGARPGQSLDQQSAEDLIWIRGSFLDSEAEFDQIIVHGHTPSAEVHVDHRRVGIDTRAYESGVLTALRLEGRAREIFQAVGPGLTPATRRESEKVQILRFSAGQIAQLTITAPARPGTD